MFDAFYSVCEFFSDLMDDVAHGKHDAWLAVVSAVCLGGLAAMMWS